MLGGQEAATMKRKPIRKCKKPAKTVLRLPDLEHARNAVLNSLSSADAQRGYRHAIDEFVDWYCSEPASPSIESSSCDTEITWNLVVWRPGR